MFMVFVLGKSFGVLLLNWADSELLLYKNPSFMFVLTLLTYGFVSISYSFMWNWHLAFFVLQNNLYALQLEPFDSIPVVIGGMVLDIHAKTSLPVHPRTTTPGKVFHYFHIFISSFLYSREELLYPINFISNCNVIEKIFIVTSMQCEITMSETSLRANSEHHCNWRILEDLLYLQHYNWSSIQPPFVVLKLKRMNGWHHNWSSNKNALKI